MTLQTYKTIENTAFVLLIIVIIVAAILVVGGIFSAIGYPIFLLSGIEWSFWRSAMAGFGTIVLGGFSFTGIGHIVRQFHK